MAGLVKPHPLKNWRLLNHSLKTLTGRHATPSDNLLLDIGLDSLDRLQLSVYIEKVFGIQSPDIDYIKYPTVLKLSEFIRDNKSRIEKGPIEWEHIIVRESHERITPGKTMIRLRLFSAPSYTITTGLRSKDLKISPKALAYSQPTTRATWMYR